MGTIKKEGEPPQMRSQKSQDRTCAPQGHSSVISEPQFPHMYATVTVSPRPLFQSCEETDGYGSSISRAAPHRTMMSSTVWWNVPALPALRRQKQD